MLNYIHAELVRIRSKKSIYLYFLICFAFYAFTLFMRSSSLTDTSVLREAVDFLSTILPIFAGTILFSVIYNDDLTAKTLPQVVGFGLPRHMIILAKFIILLIVTLITFIIGYLLYNALFFALGFNSIEHALNVIPILVTPFLMIIAYSLIASVVVYGTQRATMSIVAFLVFATGLVPSLLSMLFSSSLVTNLVGNVSPYLLTNLIREMGSNLLDHKLVFTQPLLVVLYFIVFIAVSMLVFNKKELEF